MIPKVLLSSTLFIYLFLVSSTNNSSPKIKRKSISTPIKENTQISKSKFQPFKKSKLQSDMSKDSDSSSNSDISDIDNKYKKRAGSIVSSRTFRNSPVIDKKQNVVNNSPKLTPSMHQRWQPKLSSGMCYNFAREVQSDLKNILQN